MPDPIIATLAPLKASLDAISNFSLAQENPPAARFLAAALLYNCLSCVLEGRRSAAYNCLNCILKK